MEHNRNQDFIQELLSGTSEMPFHDEPQPTTDAAVAKVTANYLLNQAELRIRRGDKSDQVVEMLAKAKQLIDFAKSKAELQAKEARLRQHWPSYFKRAEDRLIKASVNELDLNTDANRATTPKSEWGNQKINRNIAPAKASLRNLMGEKQPGDKAKCARYCMKNGRDVQGRNCSWCLGTGFIAKSAQMERMKNKK